MRGTVSRAQLIAFAVLAVVALAIATLAFRNRQPPMLPADAEHAEWAGATGCMECHAADGVVPQDTNHPLGEDCLRCHGRP